jgi:hypothetical protein
MTLLFKFIGKQYDSFSSYDWGGIRVFSLFCDLVLVGGVFRANKVGTGFLIDIGSP